MPWPYTEWTTSPSFMPCQRYRRASSRFWISRLRGLKTSGCGRPVVPLVVWNTIGMSPAAVPSRQPWKSPSGGQDSTDPMISCLPYTGSLVMSARPVMSPASIPCAPHRRW